MTDEIAHLPPHDQTIMRLLSDPKKSSLTAKLKVGRTDEAAHSASGSRWESRAGAACSVSFVQLPCLCSLVSAGQAFAHEKELLKKLAHAHFCQNVGVKCAFPIAKVLPTVV